MKIADLYIRVSTDEQADNGYSQRDQEDRLRDQIEFLGGKKFMDYVQSTGRNWK